MRPTDIPAVSAFMTSFDGARSLDRRRYVTLDAMRGVAALFVVARHFGELRGISGRSELSYLAVDFFFVLSGFVLSLRYKEEIRNGELSATDFLVMRFIRLWPLYILGLMIPIVVAICSNFADFPSRSAFIKVLLKGILLIPSNIGHNGVALFPLNPPSWSLFFEFYVANVIFVLILKLQSKYLVAIVVISAALLLLGNWFYGKVDIGVDGDNLLGGFPRVIYSFFIGVIIRDIVHNYDNDIRLPIWVPLLILIILLSLSREGAFGRVTEAAIVLFLMPALVYFGALSQDRRFKVGEILGEVSYAVYVAHIGLLSLLNLALHYLNLNPGYIVEATFLMFMVGIGILLDKVDRSVRRKLSMFMARHVKLPRRAGSGPPG